MADLISRAALLKDLSYCAPELWQDEEYIKAKIMKQPAVDAVPVVRCGDCKYYVINRLTKAYEPDKRFNPSVCIIGEFARPRKPDWYCADGERRDAEE